MELFQPNVIVKQTLGDVFTGSVYDIELGDIINFGGGAATVTVVGDSGSLLMPARKLYTSRG